MNATHSPNSEKQPSGSEKIIAHHASHHCEPLSEVEAQVISIFIRLARVAGIPRSVAEIFGLLFVSPQPTPYEEIIERLSLSAGAASQGLRHLKEIGAVKIIYVPGDRRDHYVVETGTGVATAILHRQILQYATGGAERLKEMAALLQAPESDVVANIFFLRQRVEVLRGWHSEISNLLPALIKQDKNREMSRPL